MKKAIFLLAGALLMTQNIHAEETQLKIWVADNPWDSAFSPELKPPDGASDKLKLSGAANETVYGAFFLRNPSSKQVFVRISLSGDVKGQDIVLREAVHGREYFGTVIADALPALGPERVMAIPGDTTRQLFLCVNTKDLRPGEHSAELGFSDFATNTPLGKARVDLTALPFSLPDQHPLRICVWDASLMRSTGKLQAALSRELKDHYVNTWHIYDFAPAKFDRTGKMTSPPDFTDIDRAIAPHCKDKNQFLLLRLGAQFTTGLTTADGGNLVLHSPEWKNAYSAWLKAVVEHLKSKGLDYSRWALYPFDEYIGEDFAKNAMTVKDIDPKIQIFSTIGSHPNYSAGDVLSLVKEGLLDIPQSHLSLQEGYATIRGDLRKHIKEYWLYAAPGIQKHLDPIQSFRLLGWQAWLHQANGVGYWTALGCWPPQPLWDDFASNYPNPGSVYFSMDGGSRLVPSRRWEAFKAGLSDYLHLAELKRRLDRGAGSEENCAEARKFLTQLQDKFTDKSIQALRDQVDQHIMALGGK